jgi:hypothetical protein
MKARPTATKMPSTALIALAAFCITIPEGEDGRVSWSFTNYLDKEVIGNVHENPELIK